MDRQAATSKLRSWFPCLLSLLCFFCLLSAPAEELPLVRFAVIGDSGTGGRYQYRIARQMLAWHDRLPFGLVLMLGDNIYGEPFSLGGGDKKDFEEKFDRPYAGLIARRVTFRAALGNHDLGHRGGQDLIEAYERFHIDGQQGYYSFTAGSWRAEARGPARLVEFFVINTMRLEMGKQDSEQLSWLGRALAASGARWRIVYGHQPLYSTGATHGGDVGLRRTLEPLLKGTRDSPPRVQVALAGHDHLYQRFRPIDGITYIVCGSSGQLRRGNARPSPLVAAVEDQRRVFMLWEATPFELRFRAINDRGKAFDCGVIRREAPAQTVACATLAATQ